MRTLISNIKTLVGVDTELKPRLQGAEMSRLGQMDDAWLLVEDGRIASFGLMADWAARGEHVDVEVDAAGGMVLPSWCDPHTHIVYAGSREAEFVDKIRGMSYAEIARRGGGILNSADLLHTMSEDQLYEQAVARAREMMLKGTGCIEIKSGYGLNPDDELKMLRVIRRMKETLPVRIVSTFLGAHAVGRQYTQPEYVDLIVNEMIPEVGRQRLAEYIDVFCDTGFFTPEETARILIEPSGVGKLSDVIVAVENTVADVPDMKLNSFVTVADATKVKVYMKNFGEFYNNQIESAGTIILSRTQKLTAALECAVADCGDTASNRNGL